MTKSTASNTEGTAAPTETAEETQARLAGKGRPTPTRAQREAANKRPLVSNNRTEARAKLRATREKARVGAMNGDPKYLTPRDAGPQRKFVRDWIDSRIGISEMLVPLMVVFIIASLAIPVGLQAVVVLALWVFFLAVAVEAVIVWGILKRRLTAKFGADNLQKGYRFYALMRSVQLRFTRLPKPQVKIGAVIK